MVFRGPFETPSSRFMLTYVCMHQTLRAARKLACDILLDRTNKRFIDGVIHFQRKYLFIFKKNCLYVYGFGYAILPDHCQFNTKPLSDIQSQSAHPRNNSICLCSLLHVLEGLKPYFRFSSKNAQLLIPAELLAYKYQTLPRIAINGSSFFSKSRKQKN